MNDALSRLTPALYGVALFFVLSPVVDVATSSMPIALGSEQWRFGFASIASNYLVSLLFGTILWALVAAAQESRASLRAAAWLSIVSAAFLLLLELSLVLDSLQLYHLVRPQEVGMFKIGASKAFLKIGSVMVILLVLARKCFIAIAVIPIPETHATLVPRPTS